MRGTRRAPVGYPPTCAACGYRCHPWGVIEITTDPAHIDLEVLHAWLRESYWANHRPIEKQRRAVERSLNFTALDEGQMVGFARVVTDHSTFAWLCDVIVAPDRRGQGVGKALMDAVVDHPDLRDIRRIILGTLDAHELYRGYGFVEAEPGRIMVRRVSEEPDCM